MNPRTHHVYYTRRIRDGYVEESSIYATDNEFTSFLDDRRINDSSREYKQRPFNVKPLGKQFVNQPVQAESSNNMKMNISREKLITAIQASIDAKQTEFDTKMESFQQWVKVFTDLTNGATLSECQKETAVDNALNAFSISKPTISQAQLNIAKEQIAKLNLSTDETKPVAAVEPRLQEAKTLTQEEINRGIVCFGCETENICRSFKRCQIVRDAENNVAVEPQKREYCKNCGNRIYFDKSDVLGSRYRHHGSNFVDCHNGLQTVAEPEAGSTRPEMPPASLWEVVPGKEQDDWGITEIDHAGSSIAQMMWQEDAEETVRLHNGAASVQQEPLSAAQ